MIMSHSSEFTAAEETSRQTVIVSSSADVSRTLNTQSVRQASLRNGQNVFEKQKVR
jgi:hypothetical protein